MTAAVLVVERKRTFLMHSFGRCYALRVIKEWQVCKQALIWWLNFCHIQLNCMTIHRIFTNQCTVWLSFYVGCFCLCVFKFNKFKSKKEVKTLIAFCEVNKISGKNVFRYFFVTSLGVYFVRSNVGALKTISCADNR